MTKNLPTTTMIMVTWNKVTLRLTAIVLLGLASLTALAQVPARPDPPRLVNDLAGILGDCQWLEDSLEKIAMETSNQICVVTMNDFGGYDKAQMPTLSAIDGVSARRIRTMVSSFSSSPRPRTARVKPLSPPALVSKEPSPMSRAITSSSKR